MASQSLYYSSQCRRWALQTLAFVANGIRRMYGLKREKTMSMITVLQCLRYNRQNRRTNPRGGCCCLEYVWHVCGFPKWLLCSIVTATLFAFVLEFSSLPQFLYPPYTATKKNLSQMYLVDFAHPSIFQKSALSHVSEVLNVHMNEIYKKLTTIE